MTAMILRNLPSLPHTRPSLADQGPAAAQFTTVAQLVSPGHPAPHAELVTPAISAVPVQASTPVNRSCHAVIAPSMSDPALRPMHPDLVPLEQLDELQDYRGNGVLSGITGMHILASLLKWRTNSLGHRSEMHEQCRREPFLLASD